MQTTRPLQLSPESAELHPTASSRLTLQHQFEEAPVSAAFDQKTIAAVLDVSQALLEKWRWSGDGPRYLKIGNRCRYVKRDILEFMDSRACRSTSTLGNGRDNADV